MSGPRFTAEQYDEAIQNLRLAKLQLEGYGECCSVCGDLGHQAFSCGHNPLVAMVICRHISKDAYERHEKVPHGDDAETDEFHHLLHYLAGFDFHMGEQVGPARVVIPDGFKTNPRDESVV